MHLLKIVLMLKEIKMQQATYHAVAGKGAKNCKYCPFKTDYERCPKENRITE
jgi:hypothetical protein